MDTKKIKFVFGACIAIVMLFGAYLFYMELDKGTSDLNEPNVKLIEK